MAYRYTNTDKWDDKWFLDLKPLSKLLFNYLCDNCDIAGFIELNLKKWCTEINSDRRGIDGALKGLQRGLLFSKDGDCIYIKNFLKHQKNLPLSPATNRSHRGIMARFELYKFKFEIKEIDDFIKGASMGLASPYGNGNGNGNGNDNDLEDIRENYSILFQKIIYDKKISLPEGFKDLMLEWLKYKSEKGQQYKETGLKCFINKFLKDSDSNPIIGREMLDYSMSKNYTGLFKENKSTQKQFHATDF